MARIDSSVAASIAAGVASLTVGTNLFTGPMRPAGGGMPGEAVFVLAQGGPSPTVYADGGAGHTLREPAVQILCRGESGAGALAGATDQADAILEVVELFTPADAIQALAVESAPNYLGTDEQGRHLHSINLRCWKRSDS